MMDPIVLHACPGLVIVLVFPVSHIKLIYRAFFILLKITLNILDLQKFSICKNPDNSNSYKQVSENEIYFCISK